MTPSFVQIYQYFFKIANKLAYKNRIFQYLITKNFFLNFLFYISGKHLKKLSFHCATIKDCVDLALSYRFYLLRIYIPICLESMQKRSEIHQFSKLVNRMKPKIILEIGTANGGTLFLLSRLSTENATIISVSLPVNPYIEGINYKPTLFFKSFSPNTQHMNIIKGNSHQKKVLNKVKKILKGRKIDLLFIDGDHTYNGVKQDFQMYSPMVKKGGIIAFHDIVEVPEDNVEVNKFWNEIKTEYEHREIVEDWEQGNCGIGIIFKK
jgi:cephalosporin hydroxylase